MLILKENTIVGTAVVTDRIIPKGALIMEFHGELFARSQLPRPYPEDGDFYVQIGKDLYLGPSGGLDDHINHSCDPNAALLIHNDKISLISLADIPEDAEITYDYSLTMDEDEWTLRCSCGSPLCRGIVADFKRLPRQIREKYSALGIVPAYQRKYLIYKIN